jgi:ankyrin repeat protein
MNTLGFLLFLGCAGLASAQTTPPPILAVNPLDTELQDACVKGDLRLIVEMVDQGASPKVSAGKEQITPLMVASRSSLEVTRLLIGKQTKIDATDAQGNSALNYACFAGQIDCARALLDAGANVNLTNKEGRTPLINAVRAGSTDLVTLLLAHHADVNANASLAPALVWAVDRNQIAIMKLLLDAGADVNLVPRALAEGGTDYPALHAAVATGNVEAMYLLLDHHADINLLNYSNVSPLMAAAACDDAVAVQTLLDKGARLDIQSNNAKRSALIMAARRGSLSSAQALVSSHANLELRDVYGRTALLAAAGSLEEKIVKMLVNNGADVNAVDSFGETAFGYAGSRGDVSLANWLKENGAKRTDLHIVALPRPQPPLPTGRAWALAVSAVFAQINGDNPNFLGYGDDPETSTSRGLRERWNITDRASLLKVLDDLRDRGPQADWQEEGVRVAALTDENFKTFLLVNAAVSGTSLDNFEAQAVRKNYLKWKERTGVGWSLCVSANLINRGYALHYLDEKEAWDLLLANARLLQRKFSSWAEMSDNFLDGREIWDKTRNPALDVCSQLLLNPKDPNSSWNKLPWTTDLSAP